MHASTVTAADYRCRSFTVPLSFWIPAGLRRRSRPAAPVLLARENPVLRRSPDSRLVPGPRELYAPYPYDMQKAGEAIRPRGGNDC